MAWRLARSLVQLRDEVNALAPNRSRVSDGTIGDPKHASRASRHNPNDDGVVCALDLTNDVNGGCPIHLIARVVAAHPHPNLEYIISDGEIAKRRNGFRWEPYTGTNPHTKHAHFAVGVGPDSDPQPPYDDTTLWLPAPARPPSEEDIDMEAAFVLALYAGYFNVRPGDVKPDGKPAIDAAGFDYWVKALLDGTPRQQVRASFAKVAGL